jgi:alkylation response protein AidB-like acyl-CoA dehydrogenase
MFAFRDEHKLARDLIRRWVVAKLAPANAALERNEALPYDLMRDFLQTFGLGGSGTAERGAGASGAATEREAGTSGVATKSAAGVVGSTSASIATSTSSSAAAEGQEDETGPAGMLGHFDPALQALVAIEMCRVNPGFYLAFGASIGLAGGAIMAKGTREQRRRFGRPVVSMEKIGAWAMTEPGAGSDAFGSMRTVARPDGDDYLLSGQKTFITNGPYADYSVVYAKIDHGQGTALAERPIHAFIVEKGTPGFVQSAPMRKMGMHASPTGELFLDSVRVPKSHLLGEREHETARDKAKDVFQTERTGASAMSLGIIERCLEDSIAYAKQRSTWGRPIAEYQLVQEKIARMFVHKQNVENLLFKQIWLQSQGTSMNAAEASATKLYSARAATECALEAVQLHGGNGYMQEYHVEQLARDAKLLQIGGGTDEIQILNVARQLLKG